MILEVIKKSKLPRKKIKSSHLIRQNNTKAKEKTITVAGGWVLKV
jgi:hypothetical protein